MAFGASRNSMRSGKTIVRAVMIESRNLIPYAFGMACIATSAGKLALVGVVSVMTRETGLVQAKKRRAQSAMLGLEPSDLIHLDEVRGMAVAAPDLRMGLDQHITCRVVDELGAVEVHHLVGRAQVIAMTTLTTPGVPGAVKSLPLFDPGL